MTRGGWAISDNLIDLITKTLNKKDTILELGSGTGTQKLIANQINVISVEQDKLWVNKYHNNYCYAQLKDGWYDFKVLNDFLKNKSYNAVLIDGPAAGDRAKVLTSCIDLSKIIFIDDIDRPADRDIFNRLKINRRYEDYEVYGVIYND
jgi:hypothetical protein